MNSSQACSLTACLAILTLSVAGQSLPSSPRIDDPDFPWILDSEEHHTTSFQGGKVPSEAFIRRPTLQFERNDGQTDSEVAFLSRGKGYHVFLAPEEAVLVFRSGARPLLFRDAAGEELLRRHSATIDPNGPAASENRHILRIRVLGANPHASISGEEMLRGRANYFKGNQPEKWRTNIPIFGKVRYRGIYPGVDMVYYGHEGELEYDFVLLPGADPRQIGLAFEGAEEMRLNEWGELILKVAGQEVRWRKPVVYQEVNGVRREIAGSYRVQGSGGSGNADPLHHAVAFELAAYDPAFPLVIDPRLVYSTYLGGSGGDAGLSAAVDRDGNAWLAGMTSSIDFPTKSPRYPEMAGGDLDVFVAKFNPNGELLFSSYLGGTGNDCKFEDLKAAVNAKGECFVVGTTDSADFPVVKPLQETYGGGGNDAFLTGFAPDGSVLITSTYLGGSDFDGGHSLAFGLNGDIYAVGQTHSVDFPVTENAFQRELSPTVDFSYGQRDAFLVRLPADASRFIYSTYYGRSATIDTGWDVAVNSEGSAWVVLSGACYTDCTETVLAKFSDDGSQRLFEKTIRAGTGTLALMGFPRVAVSPGGQVILAVWTSSRSLSARNRPPVAPPGYADVYVAQFDAGSGSSLGAVYLGGTGNDYVESICVDSDGELVLVGQTSGPGFAGSNFPVTDPFGSLIPGPSADVFVSKLRPADLAVTYSTVLGGPKDDYAGRAALSHDGHVLIPGQTSGDFPLANAYQPGFSGDTDGFLVKLNLGDRLKVARSEAKITVSWPASATGYVLERADSLTVPQWSPVQATVTVVGDENTVTLDSIPNVGFFRLRQQ